MNWTGTPRKYLEERRPKPPVQPHWLQVAEAARPKPGGQSIQERGQGGEADWKNEWKTAKKDISDNVLSKYAMNKDVKRDTGLEGGKAFRM
jgi:hypothetical protein